MRTVQWPRHGRRRAGARATRLARRREACTLVILALDVGQKRIGLAACDALELLASPHGVVHRRSNAQAIEAICQAVAALGAQRVVVGLPVSRDGQLHEQARLVQAFGRRLSARVGVPVEYTDEALSTVRAEELLREAGVRPAERRQRIDAAAATIILQDYLRERHAAGAQTGEGRE